MAMGKRRADGWDERDVVSRYWRRQYCYLSRTGVAAKIKRKMRRRERHAAKEQIRKGEE